MLPHRYGNLHAAWDHTVLPATRQRWHSRPYPRRSWYSIKRPRRDARLSWPISRTNLLNESIFIGTTRIAYGAGSMKRSSVRPSVRLSRRSTAAAACGRFAAERGAVRRYRSIAAAPRHRAAARRSVAANAGGVMLAAEERGWTQIYETTTIILLLLSLLGSIACICACSCDVGTPVSPAKRMNRSTLRFW